MVNLSTYPKASTGESSLLFVETQQYHRPWMWVLIGLTLGTWGVIAVVQWTHLNPETYWLSLSSLAVLTFMTVLFAGVLYKAHLITKIDDRGLQFRLLPFQWMYQQISWQDVEEVYIREYDAISDYGGWGMRYGQQGKSYTVSGRFGIQLVLSDERRILIGTRRPIELEQLILRLLYDYELK